MPNSSFRRSTPARVALVVAAWSVAVGCSSSGGKISMGRAADPSPTTTESSGGNTGGGGGATGSLTWGSCRNVDIAAPEEALAAARRDGMECATLAVPVDHAQPDGPTIDVAVARLPATGNDRIGSLVVNPGGPGGSGLEFLASSAQGLPADWRERFDIVSFDPRGVAASTPLDCLSEQQRGEFVDAEEPDDPTQAVAQAVQQEADIAAGCERDDPALFRNMGTDQVAGDLESLRAALGDERLTFLGLSYGTRIAASYAAQFPDRVRALVLDGSVTPSRDLAEVTGGQVKGIVRALDAFVGACNADTTCPLAPDAMGRLDAAAAKLDASPRTVSTPDGDELLDKDKFVTGVVTALYDPSVSAALAEAVAALDGNDADRSESGARFVLELAGQQNSQRPDGTYGNGFETQGVVNCLDAGAPLEASDVPRTRELAGPIPPLLDSDPAADAPSCTKLPTGDGFAVEANDAKDRILVVGTEGDPATPIEWTRAMATALGSPAVLTYGGSGHTASLSRSCVTDQVTAFLVDGEVPSDLRDCPKDPDESDIYAQIAQSFETMGFDAEAGKCIADALREAIDPLGIVALNREDADPELVKSLQRAALSCR